MKIFGGIVVIAFIVVVAMAEFAADVGALLSYWWRER